MSADFWGICPLCYQDDPDKASLMRDAREDYEIGLDGNPLGDPDIRMIYKVVCARCGARAEMNTVLRMERPTVSFGPDGYGICPRCKHRHHRNGICVSLVDWRG